MFKEGLADRYPLASFTVGRLTYQVEEKTNLVGILS